MKTTNLACAAFVVTIKSNSSGFSKIDKKWSAIYSYLGYYWWKWYLRLYVINFFPFFWSPSPIKNEKNVIYGRPLGFSLVIIGANFSIVVCICSSELATMTCNEGGEILSPNLTIHGRTVQRYSAKMIWLSWEEMIKANIYYQFNQFANSPIDLIFI